MEQASRHWRTDVQGLRALAVIGVVVYHARSDWLPGGFAGVDVFFVISGYLITGNLLREHASTGTIKLAAFYRKRIIRLAPAASATVLMTTIVAVLIFPPLDRLAIRPDAIASLFGVENLWLARNGTDYLGTHDASVFQQFWSLGVEEQFYVFWALAVALVLSVRRLREKLGLVVAVLTGISFVVMLIVASNSEPWAFFSAHTRAWEFGVGALAAILGKRFRERELIPRAAVALPIVGLAAVAASYIFLSDETRYPGLATLLPVVGAALVVAPIGSRSIAGRALGMRPLAWIGDRSYSIYLLHWPVMVIPVLIMGRPLTLFEAVLSMALTLALSWISHALLEVRLLHWMRRVPVRRARELSVPSPAKRMGLLVGVIGIVAVTCIMTTALPPLHSSDRIAPPTAGMVRGGAAASGFVPENVTPSLGTAARSVSPLYTDGCHADFAATSTRACSFGAGEDIVVLFGDSHAAQWFSPIRAWAQHRGKRLVTMTKSSCPSADTAIRSADLGRDYYECDAWRADALRKIGKLRPKVVILANASNLDRSLVPRPSEYRKDWQEALERTITRIQASGAETAVVHDTPAWGSTPNRALSAAVDDVAATWRPRTDLVDPDARAAERSAGRASGSLLIDPIDWLCTEQCSPVLWNLLVYRDANHITEPMAEALRPRWDDAMLKILRR